MQAALREAQTGPRHKIGDDTRYEHLTRLRLCHDARRDVNGDTPYIAATNLDLPCMKARPKRQAYLSGRTHKSESAANRPAWSIECGEDAVPRRLDQIASMTLDELATKAIVLIK